MSSAVPAPSALEVGERLFQKPLWRPSRRDFCALVLENHTQSDLTERLLKQSLSLYEAGGTGGWPFNEMSLVTRIFLFTVIESPSKPQS
jgi:hypothetical protein